MHENETYLVQVSSLHSLLINAQLPDIDPPTAKMKILFAEPTDEFVQMKIRISFLREIIYFAPTPRATNYPGGCALERRVSFRDEKSGISRLGSFE
ncbi:hypothetical protein CDAR_407261 [Caerostris darwini]|uniref:Uncharacterized protein n=1 Tax=Caerostris darwini TaxID=1538125 RepID=A0AAV4Q356_9ARAC|nr:hypothetical protein CDAR_407261 [Caerostris darwini]